MWGGGEEGNLTEQSLKYTQVASRSVNVQGEYPLLYILSAGVSHHTQALPTVVVGHKAFMEDPDEIRRKRVFGRALPLHAG
jgi:hypothetical protein